MALDELPYRATEPSPIQMAEDVEPEVDITVKSELSGIKAAMNEILDAQRHIDPKLPAEEYKIEGLANEKVRKILEPIIAVIDTRLKTGGK